MTDFKRVLHVDGHFAFRESLAKCLEYSEVARIVGEAGSATEGRKYTTPVDIVLIGLPLDDDSGSLTVREFLGRNSATIPIVLVDSIGNDASCLAHEAGARCVLPRSIHLDELVWHISHADHDLSVLDRETSITLLSRALEIKRFEFQQMQYRTKLSGREVQVLGLLADGLSDREIADRLAISVDTVRTHFVHILEKLGVRTRLQAVVLAHEYGLHKSVTTT